MSTEREKLAGIIGGKLITRSSMTETADAILAAGYRKPSLIQYVVVTQDGGVYDCSFGQDRECAQAVADQATADAKSVGMDYVYRVAELVEAAA